MSKSLQESSSKRHFHWTKKIGNEEEEEEEENHDQIPTLKSISTSKSKTKEEEKKEKDHQTVETQEPEPTAVSQSVPKKKNKLQSVAVSRLRSVLTAFGRNRSSLPNGLGPRVVGTLFGSRRGHVHFAFQRDPNSQPAFLIELATPISGLVREMASGLVRIALECDKEKADEEDSSNNNKKTVRLLEEPVWRTYCNGKKSGFATRRECGAKEWKVLKAVEPISMGAGVLPGNEAEAGSDGEVMYMRAKFERIVGSRDSEAFYMMNPDSNGTPELSVYLLRV